MDKSKRKTGAKSKAARAAVNGKQAAAKQPPIDLAKRWLAPIYTLGEAGRKFHLMHAPHAFPVEILGTVAARLLVRNDYIEAAKRAHLLLLACEAFNYHVTTERESLTKHVARLNESDLPKVVSFPRAVRFVTGQDRTDRGLPFFRKLFEALYTYPSVSDQNEHMEEMKERGFTKAYVLHLKDTFEFFRNTGQLPIREPPKKEILDAENGIKSDTKALPPVRKA